MINLLDIFRTLNFKSPVKVIITERATNNLRFIAIITCLTYLFRCWLCWRSINDIAKQLEEIKFYVKIKERKIEQLISENERRQTFIEQLMEGGALKVIEHVDKAENIFKQNVELIQHETSKVTKIIDGAKTFFNSLTSKYNMAVQQVQHTNFNIKDEIKNNDTRNAISSLIDENR